MVGIASGPDSTTITIYGHGLTVAEPFELEPGVTLSPTIPALDLSTTVDGCATFADYAAALQGSEIASFGIEIKDTSGPQQLVAKAWNALWLFHLLSVSCRTPCLILHSVSDGRKPVYSAANRDPFVRPSNASVPATNDQLLWARDNKDQFSDLIHSAEFSAAMRCFGNAHYLADMDLRIMLIWSGIEGLLSVDAELSRRIALYAALMIEGTSDEKAAFFDHVKKAYAIRSRAVHGGRAKPAKLIEGYRGASHILATLLARCVEIGRVPTPAELDRLAVTTTVQ